jgi:hypothetical protein
LSTVINFQNQLQFIQDSSIDIYTKNFDKKPQFERDMTILVDEILENEKIIKKKLEIKDLENKKIKRIKSFEPKDNDEKQVNEYLNLEDTLKSPFDVSLYSKITTFKEIDSTKYNYGLEIYTSSSNEKESFQMLKEIEFNISDNEIVIFIFIFYYFLFF